MRVLIAEDNTAFRDLLRKQATTLFDAEVIECTSGNEAIVLCREHRPDWVLMDIMLPGMDGLTATSFIHARLGPACGVIILTSYDEQAYRDAAFAAGAVAYVLKENMQAAFAIMRRPRSDIA